MGRPRVSRRWQRRGGAALLLIACLVAACSGSREGSPAPASPPGGPANAAPAAGEASEALLADLRDDSGILDPERHRIVSRLAADLNITIPEREPFLPADADRTPDGDAILRDDNRPHLFGFDWLTNFGIRIVKFEEFDPRLLRDEIVPLTDPAYISVGDADRIYSDGSPVVHLDVNSDVRAYPLEIILWHEVINDVVGGVPVLVTYCPLCNTAIAFDRRLGDTTLSFGTSGLLRNSDLVMYDHQTESVWQQIGGKALIGDLVGATLTPLPSPIVSFGQFRDAFPDALVLARPAASATVPDRLDAVTTSGIPYGITPYALYDDLDAESDFRRLYTGDVDDRLHFADRVVGLRINDEAIAYPFPLLTERRVIADLVGGRPIVVFWTPGARSALDQIAIDASRDVGSAGVFDPTVDGSVLEFDPNPDDPQTFIDRATGSTWDIFGRAVTGALAGARLTPVVHGTHLWFAWAAFEPDTALAE